MIPTKTLRELTIEGINTVLTSLEGNDKKGNPILNITKMQKKIDDSGRWISVDVLRQKLKELYDKATKYTIFEDLEEFIEGLEPEEAKK